MSNETTETPAVAVETLISFGSPPVLTSESASDYDDLRARVSTTVKPVDILEQFWVEDVTDLAWDALRLRRNKAQLLNANAHKGLKVILETIMEWHEAEALVTRWVMREAAAIEEVNKLLASMGLNFDAVMAQTLSLKLGDIERVDYMLMMAETRRNNALREVDRHRAGLAQALRRAHEEALDAILFKDMM